MPLKVVKILATQLVAILYTGKFWQGKIGKFDESYLPKIFFANIHRYTENIFGICTDCSLFAAKIFLCIAF